MNTTKTLLALLVTFSMAGCATLTGPTDQTSSDICSTPARPVIDSSDIQSYQDDGDTWVAYRESDNERLLKHIQRLENAIKECNRR